MRRNLVSPKILNIPTGGVCNNQCVFCIERDANRKVTQGATRDDEALSHMRATHTDVVFTGGEPTLNPLLPQLIERARRLGFSTIGLITNGRLLADAARCEKLLEAGLNEVTVSLHGPSAEIHDSITQRRGAFAQARCGLANLGQLRERFGFRFLVNCTVIKANQHLMRELRAFVDAFGVELVNFNVAEPRGAADGNFHVVVPRYCEVMDHADASGLDFHDPRQSLSRVPACAGGPEWIQETWHVAFQDQVRVYDAEEYKVRGPPCEACAVIDRCGGIWQRYIEGYGWEGLEPVRDPEERQGQVLRIRTGSPCNNHCAHCHDGPAASHQVSAESVGRQLRTGLLQGYRRVELGGGELLLHPAFGQWVLQARSMGFSAVALETNGRALNLPQTLEKVRGLPLDEVVVRLNAGDEALHDAMAQAPGAFRQTVRGLLQLSRQGVPFAVRVRRTPRNAATLADARQIALATGARRLEVIDG